METRVDVKRPRYRPEKEDQGKFRISGNGKVRTRYRENGQNSRGGLKVKQRNDKGKGHYASRGTQPPVWDGEHPVRGVEEVPLSDAYDPDVRAEYESVGPVVVEVCRNYAVKGQKYCAEHLSSRCC